MHSHCTTLTMRTNDIHEMNGMDNHGAHQCKTANTSPLFHKRVCGSSG